ncbi:extracellular calcium-sensing receptor-like [Erpetoichthys calabaricus]|uniref:extracellular calcium-sensing receptor-like n=1 Tax=Erpetoichthys calabaricus TaxID=27687 RepID=UPI0022348DD4|nr:extracellular calcium-sensing receptor-like [Erpetoichthys calabaricus]
MVEALASSLKSVKAGRATSEMLPVLLLLCIEMSMAETPVCQLYGTPGFPQFSKDGRVIIGAIFSIHDTINSVKLSFQAKPDHVKCQSLNFRELRFAQTMRFAVEEINNRTDLLPGVELGYKIYDSCGSVPMALKAALDFASGPFTSNYNQSCLSPYFASGIIGETASSTTVAVASTVGPLRIALVSHCASCACLSNRKEFPSFFRTIPNDAFQATALVQLVKYFGWTWIGAVRSDNDYGNYGMSSFIMQAQQEGICIEYTETFYRTDSKEKLLNVVDTIKKSTSKVIAAFMATADIIFLFKELTAQNITGFQWIGTEAWVTDPILVSSSEFSFLRGTIGIGLEKSVISGLADFLYDVSPNEINSSSVMKEFWESVFECRFPGNAKTANQTTCTGFESLRRRKHSYNDVSNARILRNVYKAVYAISKSLHTLLTCKKSEEDCEKKMNMYPWQVVQQLNAINITIKNGLNVFFDNNGDSVAFYEIINWQLTEEGNIKLVTAGYYDSHAPAGQKFNIENRSIIWANGDYTVPTSACSETCTPGTRKALKKRKPACCFDCIPCTRGRISNKTGDIRK